MADIVIDGGSSFDDLQDLIDNSENGDTIILGGDISGDSTEVDMSTIYVDSAWTGKAVGDDLGDGKIFGVNAFAGLQAAVNAVAEKLGQTGRILVRESGTEPVIRVMVEAPSQKLCQNYVEQVVDVICARGHARV